MFDRALPNDPTVVSLENKVASVKYHLKEVNTLGIVGMGGIGKTTLAKAIFDDVKSTYDASCFVGQLKSRSLLDIPREILTKFGMDKEAMDSGHAKKLMEGLLVNKKVLVILDDVMDEAQVDDIVPTVIFDRSKGTTLMITNRDWGAIRNRLRASGTKFDVSKLDYDGAKTLYNIHCSWEASHLSLQLNDIRDIIVEACKGLPLSLEVMGAHLHGKEKMQQWECALQRMRSGGNLDGKDDEIWNSLRVSFDDGLTQEEKNMFMDTTCFFGGDVHPSGISKERALRIWIDNNIPPISALGNLVHRALVTEEIHGVGGEILDLHNQLHDMGHIVAEREYTGTPILKTIGLTSCLVIY